MLADMSRKAESHPTDCGGYHPRSEVPVMSTFHHDCREWGESHHHDMLHQILHTQEKIMSTIQDLDTSITSLTATVTKLGTDLTAAIKDLEAKLASNPPTTFDPSPEIARLTAIASTLTSLDTSAVAADPGPQTPATPPTPTATTTTLTASSPAVAGETITLSGTVVGGTTPPSGTVTITDPTGAVDLTPELDSTGSFTTSLLLQAGSYSLTATYSGDAENEKSSGEFSLSVA